MVKLYQKENNASEASSDFFETQDEDSDDGGYYSTIEGQENYLPEEKDQEDLDFGRKRDPTKSQSQFGVTPSETTGDNSSKTSKSEFGLGGFRVLNRGDQKSGDDSFDLQGFE